MRLRDWLGKSKKSDICQYSADCQTVKRILRRSAAPLYGRVIVASPVPPILWMSMFMLSHHSGKSGLALKDKSTCVLVIGATGRQGKGVVDALLMNAERSFRIRAFVRNEHAASAQALVRMALLAPRSSLELCAGDLEDAASVETALVGVKAVFANLNYWTLGLEKEVALGKRIVDAAAAAGCQHFVYSSLEDVHTESGGTLSCEHFQGKAEVERYAREVSASSTMQCSFVKFGYYFENLYSPYGAPQLRMDEEGGSKQSYVFQLPLQGHSLAMVPVHDAGRVIAQVFIQGPDVWGGRSLGLASAMLTGEEIAAAFAEVVGVPAGYEDVDLSTLPRHTADMWRYKQINCKRYRAYVAESLALVSDLMDFRTWLASSTFVKGPG